MPLSLRRLCTFYSDINFRWGGVFVVVFCFVFIFLLTTQEHCKHRRIKGSKARSIVFQKNVYNVAFFFPKNVTRDKQILRSPGQISLRRTAGLMRDPVSKNKVEGVRETSKCLPVLIQPQHPGAYAHRHTHMDQNNNRLSVSTYLYNSVLLECSEQTQNFANLTCSTCWSHTHRVLLGSRQLHCPPNCVTS